MQVRSHIYFGATIADILLQRPANLRKTRADLNSLAVSLLFGLDTHKEAIDAIFSSVADAHGRIWPVIVHGAKSNSGEYSPQWRRNSKRQIATSSHCR
ncbi:hypothetical protein [Corynebacterium durum]